MVGFSNTGIIRSHTSWCLTCWQSRRPASTRGRHVDYKPVHNDLIRAYWYKSIVDKLPVIQSSPTKTTAISSEVGAIKTEGIGPDVVFGSPECWIRQLI